MFAKHYEKVTWKHINNSVAVIAGIKEKAKDSFYYDTFSNWHEKLKYAFKELSDKCYEIDTYNKSVARFFKIADECIKTLSSLYSKDHFYYSHELVTFLINNLWKGQYIHKDGEISNSDVEEEYSIFKEKYHTYIYDLASNQSVIEQIFVRADELEKEIKSLKKELKTATTTKKVQVEQKIADLKAEYNKLRKQADDYYELNEQIKLNNHLDDIITTGVKTNNPDNAYVLKEQAKTLEDIESQKEETRKTIKEVKSNKLVKDYASDIDREEKPIIEEKEAPASVSKPSDDLDKLYPELQEINRKLSEISSSNQRIESSAEDIKVTVHRSEDKLDKLSIEISKLSNEELLKRISDLFTESIKREEEGKDNSSSKEETLVYEAEMAKPERNLTTKETVDVLVGLNPPCLIGAFAVVRTLIDSWCRYVKGIELNDGQRIFNYKNDRGEIIYKNADKFDLAFKGEAGKIPHIFTKCNAIVHGDVTIDDEKQAIDQVKGYANYLIDECGIDYCNIDFVEGIKYLYRYEVKSINYFVDDTFEEAELTRNSSNLSDEDIYKYALKRCNKFKRYLVGKVDPAFFEEVGEIKTL